MTDLRALCARMADELDHYRQLLMDDRRETHALATEARALLAQPEPQGPKLIYRYCPVTIAECGGPCEQGPEYCDCGEIKGEPAPQPEPQGPTDEELMAAYWEAFKNAAPCGADQSWLAGLRAVALWDRSVIEPDGPAVLGSREPASVTDQPTDEEIDDWHGRCADLTRVGEADHYWAFDLGHDEVAGVVRAALARWGRPAIEPVPKREAEQ